MANQIINPILDPSSPYYLSSNENPAAILVSSLLNGENYHQWSRAMTIALDTKNKLCFLNGSLPRPPPTDLMQPVWSRCNNLIVSWLTQSMQPSIVQTILWMDSTAEIWKDLKERYYQGDIFKLSQIIGKILVHVMKKYRENEYIICFLAGLSDQFSAVIMLMQPLPPINNVFSILIQQERQMALENLSTSQTLSSIKSYDTRQRGRGRGLKGSIGGRSNTQGRMASNSRGRGHKICTFCQKIGHIEDVCYKKHGFPPSFSNTTTNINSYTGTDSKISEQEDEIKQEFGNDAIDIGSAFTPAQHNALKAMIQESMNQTIHKTNQLSMTSNAIAGSSGNINLDNMHKSITWILDTDATDHVCCTLAAFHDFKGSILLPYPYLMVTKWQLITQGP
ncbi:PREDICTED: uncharacterized protein LOC109350536 [Lupinus angustifolius]|uniref:uncharacterized protein LOC109350536 n=1 Tax=Lupinus angustifolius TaxID=3871 RepID=UPI00092EDA2E|nr:PREDICTED: uncharacterized protein LOC109350536 [Lupinus angustifolius]